jgi:hypothetical protein
MTITITNPQTASRRARHATIVGLIALAATMIGFGLVQTMTDDPARTTSTPAEADVSPQLAEWARTNGVSGLSPASVTPTADLDVSAQLAEWVRANGVSGLSPASVTPAAAPDVSAQLAEWARANGVSGLSPASVNAA